MEIPILHLPLDEDGTLETHLKVEEYDVLPERFYLVYPDHGPFFTGSVEVTDVNGGELKRSLDWEPFLPYQKASMELGREVHRGIIIKTTSVARVRFKRQLVGGEYSNASVAFNELVAEFMQKRAKLTWDEVIHPERFNPIDHPHHADDLKGTQDVVEAILTVADVLRWYLTGRLIEIDNVVNLRPTLDNIESGVSENKQGIITLTENIREINVALGDNEDERTTLLEKINANKTRLDQHAQHLNSHAVSINEINQKINGINSTDSRQDQELNAVRNQIQQVISNANTLAYHYTGFSSGNIVFIRKHQNTIYDKLFSTTSSHTIDHSQFLVGDTLTINMPLLGNYTTTFGIVGGRITLPDGTYGDTQSLSGNGNIELRYLGNRVFQVISLG